MKMCQGTLTKAGEDGIAVIETGKKMTPQISPSRSEDNNNGSDFSLCLSSRNRPLFQDAETPG